MSGGLFRRGEKQRLVAKAFQSSLLPETLDGICLECRVDAIEYIESSYSWYQEKIRALLPYLKEQTDPKLRAATEVEDAQSLEISASILRDDIRLLHEQISEVRLSTRKLRDEMNKGDDSETARSLEYEHQLQHLSEEIGRLVNLHAMSVFERSLYPAPILFNVGAAHDPRSVHVSTAFSINGHRIALYPNKAINLNWSEINCSWGLIGLAIGTLIRKYNVNSKFLYYEMTTLRARLLLRRVIFTSDIHPSKPYSLENPDIIRLGPSLGLHGKTKSSAREQYLEAIAALCVLLASLARQIDRSDALVGLLPRVLLTLDRHGPDVIAREVDVGLNQAAKMASRPTETVDVTLQSSKAELLPHWRYLFTASERSERAFSSPLTNGGNFKANQREGLHPSVHQHHDSDISKDILETINNLS
jgi:hypothetical protein